MISVIIACGGSSTRMGKGVNKLLLTLEGMTVIERTVMAFCEIDEVSEIILCCSESFKEEFLNRKTLLVSKTLKFAENGETRQKSITNGFKECDPSCELVCVHDGARPLISGEVIRAAVDDAKKYGSAVVCVPCKDTVKISDSNGAVLETPPRERLFLTQTPQIFTYEGYKKAVSFAEENSLDFTDDSQLFEAMGIMPHITVGDYSNIKITTPDDIAVASQLISQRKQKGL